MSSSKPKTSYKSKFTPEQKEAYKQKQETEKQEFHDLYKLFVEKKTIKDFIGIIANYKEMHAYSLGNYIYTMAQACYREDEKFIGILNSYQNWKKQDIQVLKGMKAYKVRVPIFSKIKNLESEENQERDQNENEKSNDQEDKKKIVSYFKHGNVFDLWQTSEHENYLKEQEKIDEIIIKNAEIDYDIALEFARTTFPELTIKERFKSQAKKGVYIPALQQITLYQRSSQTILHEVGHHIVREKLQIKYGDYAKGEVLAEMVAYFLMKGFDESIEYNFAYSNVWSSRIEDSFEVDEFIAHCGKILEFIHKIQH